MGFSITKYPGVSLLEMMLVLVIAMILLLVSVRAYQQYHRQSQIVLFQRQVLLLMQSLNTYYYGNCHNPELTHITIPKLLDEGYLSALPVNPWGDFVVFIANRSSNDNQPFYDLEVLATFVKITDIKKRAALTNILRESLNAESATGSQTLIWRRLPLNTTDEFVTHKGLIRQGIAQPLLPAQHFSAITSANNSKLWLMDSSLYLFSQQQQFSAHQYPLIAQSACPQ